MAEPGEAMREGSNTNTKYGPNNISDEERKQHEKFYHKDTAGRIIGLLRTKPMALSIFLRKYRNLDYIFKHELEPLFMEEVN